MFHSELHCCTRVYIALFEEWHLLTFLLSNAVLFSEVVLNWGGGEFIYNRKNAA